MSACVHGGGVRCWAVRTMPVRLLWGASVRGRPMSADWWFGLCYGLGIGAVVTDWVRGRRGR